MFNESGRFEVDIKVINADNPEEIRNLIDEWNEKKKNG